MLVPRVCALQRVDCIHTILVTSPMFSPPTRCFFDRFTELQIYWSECSLLAAYVAIN